MDAVHIVSHGTDRAVKLGETWLTADTLSTYRASLSGWGESLSANADLLFYGCNLAGGADGRAILAELSVLTGADVAASVDDTGAADRGGDWELEFALGQIESSIVFSQTVQAQWHGLLNTFVVTNVNNSGAGSLRQAILDANGLAGADTITFNISGTGVHTINITSALPTITDTVTIDATTDDSFAANGNRPAVVLDGNNSFSGDGLVLTSNADGSTIRGLVIRDFNGDGIQIDTGSNNNTIAGNYIGRLTPTGADAGASEANTGSGINLLGGNNTIGGLTSADRNVISGNTDGIYSQLASGNTIIGNYIGTDATGLVDLGNSDRGIQLESGANNTTIGGTTPTARNVISGNDNDGIVISDGSVPGTGTTGTVIQGNYIGVGADGVTALGNGTNGVRITTESSHLIGGTVAGAGNVIAHSGEDGVMLQNSTANSNPILGNTIYSNTQLGIDLGNNGVTTNDAGDADSGANNLQNFPVLTSASSSGGNTTISGSLNSTASTTFRIEFFSSSTGDSSGYGEGQNYLGFATVTTNGSGNATFNANLVGVSLASLDVVTATATVDLGGGNYGSTSEFAANILANYAQLHATQDTYIQDANPGLNDGAATSLVIDREDGDLQRALFQFDVSSIPVGATINSATLKLQSTQIGGSITIGVYELLQSWSEGTGNGTSGTANWNQRSSGTNWTSAGGTYNATPVDTLTTDATGVHSWDLTQFVADWVSGSKTNNGILVGSPDGGGNRTVTYDSREGTVQPVLEIVYNTTETGGFALWRRMVQPLPIYSLQRHHLRCRREFGQCR